MGFHNLSLVVRQKFEAPSQTKVCLVWWKKSQPRTQRSMDGNILVAMSKLTAKLTAK